MLRRRNVAVWGAGAVLASVALLVPAALAAGDDTPVDPVAVLPPAPVPPDEELELQSIPADAPVAIAENAGTGDSELLEFAPGAEYFTFLVTCLSESGGTPTKLRVVDAADPEMAVPVRCDSGRQAVTFNAGSNQVETFRLEAAPTVSWVASVYVGMPESVSIE